MPDDNFVEDISENSGAILKVGENNNLRLKARELNILKYSLKINENPYDTLMIYSHYDNTFFYNQSHINTVIYFWVLPMSLQFIYGYTKDWSILRYRSQIIDTIDVQLADTTYSLTTTPAADAA